jgi:hypothetical protein
MQIRQRRFAFELQMPTRLNPETFATKQQDRQVIVIVLISV